MTTPTNSHKASTDKGVTSLHLPVQAEFINIDMFARLREVHGLANRWSWEYKNFRSHSAL